jgi:D-glycero-alpha-D-manno-heptose-7-phosphate kinase
MIIARAPLRISFFGGGTDFPEHFRECGGAVLATAIDKYSYVTASAFQSHLFDYAVRVSYSRGELVRKIEEIQHPVFRECLRFCGLDRDVELHAVADLPAFTGLGSSSTFTVCLLQALHAYSGKFVPSLQLAYEAIHIERHVLGECVGVQDQTTAAVGGFNILEFKAEDNIRVTPLGLSPRRIEEFEAHLLALFTGIKRRAAEIESRKVKNLNSNQRTLRHMQSMAYRGFELLSAGRSLSEFGALLHEAWQAKRSLDPMVSNEEIDALYRRGIEAGAWGGKLLGAGGGGFLLFMAPPDVQPRLRAAFPGMHTLSLRVSAPGSQVIFS